jgi:hypothetical protein
MPTTDKQAQVLEAARQIKHLRFDWRRHNPCDLFVLSAGQERILAEAEQITQARLAEYFAIKAEYQAMTEIESRRGEDTAIDDEIHKAISDRIGGDAYFGLPPREHVNS